MVAALARWALDKSGVSRVIAETEPANVASCRVLEKAGFVPVGVGNDPGSVRFALLKTIA